MATETVQLKVSGLMCSFCTMSVETALKRYPGVKSVMVNLVHGIVLVETDAAKTNREALAEAVEKLGYNVSETLVQQYQTDEDLFGLIKQRGTIGLIVSIIDLLVDPVNIFSLPLYYRTWFSFAVATFVLLWVGYPILRKTAMALSQRVINANVLLSAGAWGSFIIGTLSLFNPEWPNFLPVAAWLMSLHLFFAYFKLDTRKKASEAVRKLMSLLPPKGRVNRGDQLQEIPVTEISIGEVVEVRPGERLPLDGEIIEGIASIDESSFTGESVPVTKEPEAHVIGGTLNLDGALRVRVTKIGEDTFLNQIIRLMSQIAERKPPIELLADRIMNYYGPVVFIVAGIAFTAWALVTNNYTQATLALITTIIMGYPCALGITTPMLAAIAGGKGISIGLLVKASEVFHGLSIVDTVIFDKTGTLTYGRPTVTDVVPFEIEHLELLALAAAVENQSEHPLGQAIVFFAKREGAGNLQVKDFRSFAGKGVRANVEDSEVIVGKPLFVQEMGMTYSPAVQSLMHDLGSKGKTVVVIASNGQVKGLIALQDTPRRGAAEVIKKLQFRGIKTAMLTGDAEPVSNAIASQLGIDDVYAELLPQDKVKVVQQLQSEGRKVAMVGDGINDAPALAQSDVGIAIGAGTDVAIESAGVILIGDRLDDVLNALILGKASYQTLTGNVLVAILFNVIGMLLAAMGYITPLLAISVMILSIFTILINTLRIRNLKLERPSIEKVEKLSQVEFSIPNMMCEGCAETIYSTLNVIPGVKGVKSKVPQKQVLITYETEEVSQQNLKDILQKSGFAALEI